MGFLPVDGPHALQPVCRCLRNTVTGLRGGTRPVSKPHFRCWDGFGQKLFRVGTATCCAGHRSWYSDRCRLDSRAALFYPDRRSRCPAVSSAGLQAGNYASVITGSAVAAALNTIDGLIRLVEHGLQERKRRELIQQQQLVSYW